MQEKFSLVDAYAEAVRMAQRKNQVSETSDYYITLAQLESILRRVEVLKP